MLEFEKTLAGKYKMYVDPAFANGEPITEESLKVGYKGSTEYKIPPGRIEFGSGADWNHRQCAACGGIMNPADCPDKAADEAAGIRGSCLVWHGWHCSLCGGTKEDHIAFEASMSEEDYKPHPGFICAPYIPKGMCGCGFVHESNERCGPW